jgi:hypothetical protein
LVSVLRFFCRTVVPATQLPTRASSLQNRAGATMGLKSSYLKYRGTRMRLDDICCFSSLLGSGYLVTSTDSSAGGGKRSVTSVVLPARM